MSLIKAWSNVRSHYENYAFSKGHTISFTPHSAQRAEEREISKEQVLHLANVFAESKKASDLKAGRRFAIRSSRDNLIVVLGVSETNPRFKDESDFKFSVVTVWNHKDGEFFHHLNDTVLEFHLTRKGPRFFKAEETNIKRNYRQGVVR